MNKELFVSSTPHETKVGLVEDDLLAEVYLERENEYTLAGSIYKGRVTRVLPGMQSAFVDIGLERDAFLYVSDFMELEEHDDDLTDSFPRPAPYLICASNHNERKLPRAMGKQPILPAPNRCCRMIPTKALSRPITWPRPLPQVRLPRRLSRSPVETPRIATVAASVDAVAAVEDAAMAEIGVRNEVRIVVPSEAPIEVQIVAQSAAQTAAEIARSASLVP